MEKFVRFVSRSSFGQEAGLRCGGYGYEPWKTHQCGPRRLGSYAVLWIPRGAGWLETETTAGRLSVEPASLLWLFPSVTHRYAPELSGWEEHWVIFSGALAEAFERDALLSPAHPLTTLHQQAAIDEVTTLFQRLQSDFMRPSAGVDLLGAAAITRLIVRFCLAFDHHDEDALSLSARQKTMGQARRWIDEHATEAIDFPALAHTYGLGYSTFRRQFLAATGLTPKTYQLQARLTKAKELLAYTWLSVAEVAMASGFADAYYFSRLFHQKEEVSPTAFRQQYRFAAATDKPL